MRDASDDPSIALPSPAPPPARGRRPFRAAVLGLVLAAGLAACTPGPGESKLLIPVNPLCTTCDDFIRCEAAPTAGAAEVSGEVYLYHLGAKSFVAQMLTIFDYLLQAFREREKDIRPTTVYPPGGGAPQSSLDAVTDLRTQRISLAGGWIDQANGAWHGADDAVKGRCRLLPIAEGRALVKELRGNAGP